MANRKTNTTIGEVPVGESLRMKCGCVIKVEEHDNTNLTWIKTQEVCRGHRNHTDHYGIVSSTKIFYDPIDNLINL